MSSHVGSASPRKCASTHASVPLGGVMLNDVGAAPSGRGGGARTPGGAGKSLAVDANTSCSSLDGLCPVPASGVAKPPMLAPPIPPRPGTPAPALDAHTAPWRLYAALRGEMGSDDCDARLATWAGEPRVLVLGGLPTACVWEGTASRAGEGLADDWGVVRLGAGTMRGDAPRPLLPPSVLNPLPTPPPEPAPPPTPPVPAADDDDERGRRRVGVAPGRVMKTSLPLGASVSSASERLTLLAKGGACRLCSLAGVRPTGPPGAGTSVPGAGVRRSTTSHRTSSSEAGRHWTLTTKPARSGVRGRAGMGCA